MALLNLTFSPDSSAPSSGVPRGRALLERPLLPEPAPARTAHLVLPGLLVLCWVLFELTANATLSVLVACLKFGWEDFRTAHWLRGADPDRDRGRACSWFYLASGVWKTAVMPILLIMILAACWAVFNPRAPRAGALREQMASAILVAMVAAATLVVVVAVAVAVAARHEVRVWVHHELHRSRRERLWPPAWTGSFWQHENRGRAILATALIFATIGFPPLAFRLVVTLEQRLEIAGVLAIVFGTPMLATCAYAVLRERVFAASPEECWPLES
jgi:hypothetical protein